MKCFERVVLSHIQSSIPNTTDPLQYAYRSNRSTSDAIAAALHVSLSHLENKDSYVRILFIDYSSAFNTVVPHRLTYKLSSLGLHPTLCDWLLSFLTGRPQSVRIGNRTSAIITHQHWYPPQGCRITGGDEAAYRKEVDSLVAWCTKNNLTLNTDKTKEMIVDMRKERRPHQPLFIRDLEVERVSSFKYLGVHISDDLTWTLNTTYVLKRAQQRLYFLRRLRKFGMSPRILSNFRKNSCIIESILTSCITVWYGSTTVKDRKRLQRVVKTATKITKMAQPSLQSIYNLRVHRRAASIIKDPTHPQHGLFTLLPSGRRKKGEETVQKEPESADRAQTCARSEQALEPDFTDLAFRTAVTNFFKQNRFCRERTSYPTFFCTFSTEHTNFSRSGKKSFTSTDRPLVSSRKALIWSIVYSTSPLN
ncbi:hypothetical protein NFI96_004026 [Prochilodus magdalenae]|nr:hypothetical protein NFI96_004026 [Prochilodus magdalenae]